MTRLVLDSTRTVGAVRMGVISELGVSMRSGLVAIHGHGRKTPRFVLVEGPTGLSAFEPAGTSVALAEIEAHCPDLLAEFRSGGGDAGDH